jgi:hypothetical protein
MFCRQIRISPLTYLSPVAVCVFCVGPEEITPLLQFMRDKSAKKLHSEKYKEKAAAKLQYDPKKAGKVTKPLPGRGGGYSGDEVSGDSAAQLGVVLNDQIYGPEAK